MSGQSRAVALGGSVVFGADHMIEVYCLPSRLSISLNQHHVQLTISRDYSESGVFVHVRASR